MINVRSIKLLKSRGVSLKIVTKWHVQNSLQRDMSYNDIKFECNIILFILCLNSRAKKCHFFLFPYLFHWKQFKMRSGVFLKSDLIEILLTQADSICFFDIHWTSFLTTHLYKLDVLNTTLRYIVFYKTFTIYPLQYASL